MRGFASRVPLPPGAGTRRTGGKKVVRATPWFSPLVRHERRAKVDRGPATFSLPSAGVALTTVIPGGKASGRPFAVTVDECTLVLLCNLLVA